MILEQKQKKKDAEGIDRQYQTTLKQTGGATTSVSVDPWANMRAPDNSKK